MFYPDSPVYQPQMTPGKSYTRIRTPKKCGCYGNYNLIHTVNKGQRYPTDIIFYETADDWIYFKTAESEGKAVHSSQKPVALGQYLIRSYSRPGAIIMDNACGSGTFPVAAIREGRRFIAIEQNQHIYYQKDQPLDLISYCRARFAQEQSIYKQTIKML